MKILFTTSGKALNSPLEPRFGRSPGFLVYDLDNGTFEAVENPNVNAAQGAGIQTAQIVVRLEAKALVTGHCGPKAFQVLQAAGIPIFYSAAATVAEALAQYREGQLVQAQAANR
ncbi:MAG: NifB/NifX family molybdenum-iron cluster-binding protein [Desulfobulbaceae bacterium]|nr:NifB/NifX family molybdenum-iron cluster-binding protein [Desulfobulbaceae bacterium]